MTDPLAITAGTWHDQAPTVAAAAAVPLRISEGDPDWERLQRLAQVACVAIDMRLELQPATGRMSYPLSSTWAVVTYAPEEAPADVFQAAVQLTAELSQRPLFGISGAWSPTGEAVRIARDHLAGVEPLLLPHVEGWGLA